MRREAAFVACKTRSSWALFPDECEMEYCCFPYRNFPSLSTRLFIAPESLLWAFLNVLNHLVMLFWAILGVIALWNTPKPPNLTGGRNLQFCYQQEYWDHVTDDGRYRYPEIIFETQFLNPIFISEMIVDGELPEWEAQPGGFDMVPHCLGKLTPRNLL